MCAPVGSYVDLVCRVCAMYVPRVPCVHRLYTACVQLEMVRANHEQGPMHSFLAEPRVCA